MKLRLQEEQQGFMNRALCLARKSVGRSSPNPPVGCVLVRGGEVVGEGHHIFSQQDHAEVVALRGARERARGSTAYVTLEPCSHHGRTPPCVSLLLEAGIRRVVIPLLDPNPKVCGRGVRILRSAGVEVVVAHEFPVAAELIEPFACFARRHMPLVVSKAGMTLDGRIAAGSGLRTSITSRQAMGFTQSLRLQLDAVLVGRGTALSDDPRLDYRGPEEKSPPLLRVLLDTWLRTSAGARLFSDPSVGPVLVFCCEEASSSRQRRLEARRAEVVRIPRNESGLDLRHVLGELAKRNVLGVLVEGGARVHWSFLKQQLVDKFFFIIAPRILGGSRALPVVAGKGSPTLGDSPAFRIRDCRRCGQDLILEAYPRGSRSILSPWRPSGRFPSPWQGPGSASTLR